MFWESFSITDNLVSKCLFLVYFFILFTRLEEAKQLHCWLCIETILVWSFSHFKQSASDIAGINTEVLIVGYLNS